MKYYASLLICLLGMLAATAQDTTQLKLLYDRCLEFDDGKADSICYYASFIETQSAKLRFNKGAVLSLRLKGICHEYKADYEKAIDFYLQSLEESRKIKEVAYEISALSDLAIAYFGIERTAEAKKFYLQCARLALRTQEVYTVVTSYNNLGVIYNQLKQYDSALIFLNEALRIGAQAGDKIDASSTYNNLGNAYFKTQQFDKAFYYFNLNYQKHRLLPEEGALIWTDHLNLADVYIELLQFDSAYFHANKALDIALTLRSKSKEADSYSILAKLNEYQGNFEDAYHYMTKWYKLDTAIVNGSTQNTISELQEKYNARQREAENKLLLERIENERYRNRSVTYLAIALGVIVIVSASAFVIKRNDNRRLTGQNEMIRRQNQRLAELNAEKNSLISIVSHDLATPFATMQVWGKVLESDDHELSADQQKALERIKQAGVHGQKMIEQILDVERAEAGIKKLELESFDICVFVESVADGFRPTAHDKEISIHTRLPDKSVYILSDKKFVHRIIENLITNAIKYSPRGRSIWVAVTEEGEWVQIKVRDEGVGIEKDELPLLFTKYSKISSRPTGGEPSTGLGLAIVKRMVEELNGRIFCESEKGQGSVFTVVLKK
jgi:signal transduction histidine kinase